MSLHEPEILTDLSHLKRQNNHTISLLVANKPGVMEILIRDIHPNPNQPRREFDQASLEELANQGKADGLAYRSHWIYGCHRRGFD